MHTPTLWDDTDRRNAVSGLRSLLRLMGTDPDSPGLVETPGRVIDALCEYADGGDTDVADLLKVQFDLGVDEIVHVGPVEFTSVCEHHLLPFHGVGHLAYIPAQGRVVGLSKLPRLLDHYAARPQMQERLTMQVADAICEHLAPVAVGVILRAQHTCLTLRGARKRDAEMTTSAMRGAFRDKPEARAELLALIGVA